MDKDGIGLINLLTLRKGSPLSTHTPKPTHTCYIHTPTYTYKHTPTHTYTHLNTPTYRVIKTINHRYTILLLVSSLPLQGLCYGQKNSCNYYTMSKNHAVTMVIAACILDKPIIEASIVSIFNHATRLHYGY